MATTPIIEGTERLWARLDALYDRKTQQRTPIYIQPELFHYTSVEGLQGIVESNTLWASSAYHLNDSSEIEYGCQLLVECLNEWIDANSKQGADNSATLSLLLLDVLRTWFTDPLSRLARHAGIYVSCFCENGNLLSQWRAYGQKGGYSIGMLSAGLESGIRAPGFFTTRLLKVNYSREQQKASIHSLIRDFLEIVENRNLYIFPTARDVLMEFASKLGTFFQELFIDEVVAFKNAAFEEEREWRVVVRPRLIEMQRARQQAQATGGTQPQEPAGTDIQYRHAKGHLVPYLKLSPFDTPQLPIQSLRFGPSLDKMRTEYSLMGFLVKHGYKKIRVFGSDMPVIL